MGGVYKQIQDGAFMYPEDNEKIKYKPGEIVWRFSAEGYKQFDKAVKEWIKKDITHLQ